MDKTSLQQQLILSITEGFNNTDKKGICWYHNDSLLRISLRTEEEDFINHLYSASVAFFLYLAFWLNALSADDCRGPCNTPTGLQLLPDGAIPALLELPEPGIEVSHLSVFASELVVLVLRSIRYHLFELGFTSFS